MALCLLTGCSCFCFFFGIQLVALRASKRLHDRFMQGRPGWIESVLGDLPKW